MVSVTIHNLFIDFLVSHQFGRLILDCPCGFGEYCWLYCVAIFQGHKMMKHVFEGRTLSICIYTDSLYFLPEFLSLSTSYVFRARLQNFGTEVSQKFGQVGVGHRGLKWLGFGVFCVPGFLLVFAVIFFSVRNEYISWG